MSVLSVSALSDGRPVVLFPDHVAVYHSNGAGVEQELVTPPWRGRGYSALVVVETAREPLVLACGALPVNDGGLSPGADVFEPGVPATRSSRFASLASAALAPPTTHASFRIHCPPRDSDPDVLVRCACSAVVCRLRGVAAQTRPGPVLAIGGSDGRVDVISLAPNPNITSGWTLPLPSLPGCDGSVIALAPTGGPLGLLVAALPGGIAVWQLGSRQLLSVLRPSPSMQTTRRPCQELLRSILGSGSTLLVAVSPRSLGEASRCRGGVPARRGGGCLWTERRSPIGPGEFIGLLVVASCLEFVDVRDESGGGGDIHRPTLLRRLQRESRSSARPLASATTPCATRLRLSLGGCTAERSFFQLGVAVCPRRGVPAPRVVHMAATSWVLCALDVTGVAHLWRVSDAICLMRLFDPRPAPSLFLLADRVCHTRVFWVCQALEGVQLDRMVLGNQWSVLARRASRPHSVGRGVGPAFEGPAPAQDFGSPRPTRRRGPPWLANRLSAGGTSSSSGGGSPIAKVARQRFEYE